MTVPYDKSFAKTLLVDMLRIRSMEEKCAQLYGEGKIRGFLHLYIGEEAVAVGVLHGLSPEDNVVATYREHGPRAGARHSDESHHGPKCMASRKAARAGMAAPCIFLTGRRAFLAAPPLLPSGIPLAVGVALADKMQRLPASDGLFLW